MLIRQTAAVLVAMLDAAGVHPGRADARTTVEVFRRFAALPVEDAAPAEEDGDGVLAQSGTSDLRGRPQFCADLTRQLIGAGAGHPPMWQLRCTLYWTPGAETGTLPSADLWSFGTPLDAFFTGAAALPGWEWALTGARAPRELAVTLWEV